MLSCSRQVGRDTESWCYPGQSLIGAQVRRATWLIAFWQQKLISQNTLKSVKICIYDVESSRQSAMVEKLYNFSDCDASRKCFLWLVGRVETVHKIMFFQSINGERMGCPWTTSQIDITTNVCQFWNRCPWSKIHEHNYTNTQTHKYTITQKIHKCLPVLKPITPVRPRSSCLVLRLVTARCESALVSPVTWEIRKYTNTQTHK